MSSIVGWLAIFTAISARTALGCGFPGSPPHAKIVTTDERFMEGSVVTFECDPGYQLLGHSMLRCVNSEWDSQGRPYCVRELAFLKPSAMPSWNQTAMLAVDDQDSTCVESDSAMKHEWWVDLIETNSVQVVEVRFGMDMSNVTINVIVTNLDSSRTSNCFGPVSVPVRVGASHYLTCERNTFGRKLTVTISASQEFALKLCEVRVYSQGVLSPQDACGGGTKGKIETLKGRCYEVTPTEIRFEEAVALCRSQGGWLWNGEQSEFISWMMNVHNLDSIWYEDRRNSSDCSTFSRDNQSDQSEHRNSLCNESRFGICVRQPQSCGKPGTPQHLASWNRVDRVSTGAYLDDFRCENGYHLSGPSTYRCLENGIFEQKLPTTCVQSTCGKPPTVANAFPILGSESRYYCVNDSFVLYGEAEVECDPATSQWSTPHVVCVRFPISTKYVMKSLRERLLQGVDLFPTTSKVGLAIFVFALIVIKILIIVAVFNLVRFYRVVKPELVRKHNSTAV